MSANSKIEWCDHTFNPWIGCQKVSPACLRCYAEKSTPVRVLRAKGMETWGVHAPRHRTSPAAWGAVKRWDAAHEAFYAEHGRRQRVFCASLADVFDNAVPAQWRRDLFDLIQATPHLDWLLLTKRIGNARSMYADAYLDSARPWPANVWIGATVVSQEEADRDVPKLLAVPARVRFLSMEPLLESVIIWRWAAQHCERHAGPLDADGKCPVCESRGIWGMLGDPGLAEHEKAPIRRGLDWVIVGGESGPGARPMHPDWARSLRDQCAAAGVPFFFKQWGEWQELDTGMQTPLVAKHGDDEFYDAAMEHDGFLSADGHFVDHVDLLHDDVPYRGLVRKGKKAAGRALDGRTHDEFPS